MLSFAYAGELNTISGVTSWLIRLLDELKNRGIDFDLHLHHLGKDAIDASLYGDGIRAGWNVSSIPIPATSRSAVREVLHHLNRVKPSVFLPHSLPSLHFSARIAQKSGLPWIFTIHSDDPEYWALADTCGPDRLTGAWVAVSEAIANEARIRYPAADVRFIPYGVRIPDLQSNWNSDRFRVVYSGRMVERQKCISKVLDVFAAACEMCPKIEAVFIGDGAVRSAIEKRVTDMRLQDRISFTGRLDADGVQKELLSAQAVLLMSDFEGLPLSLLEAMSCGVVPVVRNIRSGIPEIIHNRRTGFLVEDDVHSAAQTLTDLASDMHLWLSVSAQARELAVSRYDEKKCFEQWIALIHEMEEKSAVSYPLKVPLIPNLPRYDSRLAVFDQRTPLLLRKIGRRMRRLFDLQKAV
jgi:glycosyltransferase involved in cell wall biosynthesis